MRTLRLLGCALSCVGLASAASAQELVRVPKTRVWLAPPPGFTETRLFSGFENPRAGWMIRVETFHPSEYPRFAEAFSSPEKANALFGPDGIRITRTEQLSLDSGDVPLAIGVQKRAFGRDLVKYMALMREPGLDRAPVVIMFNLSRSSSFDRSDVETVLRSVKIDDPPTLAETIAQLPFGFQEVPPFHTTDAAAGWVWLADDADPSARRVLIRISENTAGGSPAETARNNEGRIRGELFGKEPKIVEQRTEMFAGGPGDFIMASADGRTVLQFLRRLPDNREVWFAAGGESRAIEQTREAIMEIARSVELRE